MSPPSKKDSDIRADVLKLPDKYGDNIFDWIPALETDAATNRYDQYLGDVLQVVPAHPVPGHGLTKKQYSELLTLIQLLNKPRSAFLQYIKSAAHDTDFVDIVSPHLKAKNGNAALAAVRDYYVRQAERSSELENIKNYFEKIMKKSLQSERSIH